MDNQGTTDIERRIRTFARRKYLKLPEEESTGILTLKVDSPIILARLAAVVRQAYKREDPDTIILSRGQTKPSLPMRPSLFRSDDTIHVQQLLIAQEQVSHRLQLNGLKRFNRPDLPALLQHYGVATTWLDCVDNLFVAIWFATHRYDPTLNAYAPLTLGESGWIYFISTRTESARLKAIDLRDSHHNLCVRPHVQHGWSVTRKEPDWSDDNRDLGEFVPVGVRFEHSNLWAVASDVLSPGLLFPSVGDDNTLKVLRNAHMDTILRATEIEQGLSAGSLGQLFVPM